MSSAFIENIIGNLIAVAIGTIFGYYTKIIIDIRSKRKINRAIIDFFGLNDAQIYIIHSAILDHDRHAYNYPSCDTRAARMIAHLMESTDRIEGKDFFIKPDNEFIHKDGTVDEKLWNSNVVFLCGPKRNYLLAQFLNKAPKLRYDLTVDSKTGDNVLYDNVRNSRILASRDIVNQCSKQPQQNVPISGYDYGLILSMPNPMNVEHKMVVLAGIHGAGTLGAANFASQHNILAELVSRRRGGIVQEVIRAVYEDDSEKVVEVQWA